MPANSYGFQYDEYGNTSGIVVRSRGVALQANSYTNKGTAFTYDERRALGLSGTLPPSVRSLAEQVVDSAKKVVNKEGDIEKFIYLRSLFDRNVTLAHALIKSDIETYMRLIYTPTVGLASRHYSSMFRQANGLHFYPENIDTTTEVLRRYVHRDIRVAVVTDNQGILGIGDQGAGGIAICLGKLMLYTQGAGIAPWHCLPISLDVGTDNPELLNDPNYLGWRHKRLVGDDYVDFVQGFARAFRSVFPNALCQWEDFSKQKAFAIRDSYLHDLISFNDDIQGTGAVALAAIFTAMKIKKEKITEQTYLIHGAGAGGVGIAEQIATALVEEGLTPAAAAAKIYTMDSRGLVTTARELEAYKQKFAKDVDSLAWYNTERDGELLSVVKNAGITVLIGTSGQAGCFSRDIVMAMQNNARQPVIMPLSNPNEKVEALPKDIYSWTNGQALVASGSPFADIDTNGGRMRVGQCNNVFVFPGVGLGVLASGAREVRPEFFTAAARAVSDQVSGADMDKGILMPPIEELSRISDEVALVVGREAVRSGVGKLCVYSTFQHNNDDDRLAELVQKMQWQAEYLPLIPK